MTDLTLVVRAHGPAGWVDLDDESAGLELHRDSFAARSTSQRKSDVSGGLFIAGTFTKTAVPDNVAEPVAVWVTGTSTLDYRQKMRAVKDIFDQVTYQMEVSVGDAKETWTCFAADYTEETEQAYLIATTGLLRVVVPHLPDVVLEEV